MAPTTDPTTPATLRLAILIGSVRQGRFGPTVAAWFVAQAQQRPEFVLDVIDLQAFALPSDMSPSDQGSAFAERIGLADAFVVVTPEYNHSYPGPLKTAIDSVGAQWYAKPVAFVAYGGVSGGLRAVEPLRGVFAELHAVTIRTTVSFHRARTQFTPEGTPLAPEAVNAAAAALLTQLRWWASALQLARRTDPYAG